MVKRIKLITQFFFFCRRRTNASYMEYARSLRSRGVSNFKIMTKQMFVNCHCLCLLIIIILHSAEVMCLLRVRLVRRFRPTRALILLKSYVNLTWTCLLLHVVLDFLIPSDQNLILIFPANYEPLILNLLFFEDFFFTVWLIILWK